MILASTRMVIAFSQIEASLRRITRFTVLFSQCTRRIYCKKVLKNSCARFRRHCRKSCTKCIYSSNQSNSFSTTCQWINLFRHCALIRIHTSCAWRISISTTVSSISQVPTSVRCQLIFQQQHLGRQRHLTYLIIR